MNTHSVPFSTVVKATLVLFLVAIGLVHASKADAVPSWERCGDYRHEFTDVSRNSVHCKNIVWLHKQGITKIGNRYNPSGKVFRGSMTAFLYRLENPHLSEPKCASKPYSDVSLRHKFCGHIDWAKRNNVTTGVGGGRFAPEAPVTRGAMVAFLHRISTNGAKQPKCTSRPFQDVPTNHKFCGYITWAKQNRITTGVGDGRKFAPSSSVTRGAMATFIKRVFDHRWPKNFDDGQYKVGKRVSHGLYRTKIPKNQWCYWARLGSTSSWDILVNDSPESYGLIEIKRGDAFVESSGCGTWRPVSQTPDWNFMRGRIPGSGDFLVGRDIAPGTYRQAGSDGCYWERARNATGDFGSIIENDLPSGQSYVTIEPSDRVFKTQGCAEWRLVP